MISLLSNSRIAISPMPCIQTLKFCKLNVAISPNDCTCGLFFRSTANWPDHRQHWPPTCLPKMRPWFWPSWMCWVFASHETKRTNLTNYKRVPHIRNLISIDFPAPKIMKPHMQYQLSPLIRSNEFQVVNDTISKRWQSNKALKLAISHIFPQQILTPSRFLDLNYW